MSPAAAGPEPAAMLNRGRRDVSCSPASEHRGLHDDEDRKTDAPRGDRQTKRQGQDTGGGAPRQTPATRARHRGGPPGAGRSSDTPPDRAALCAQRRRDLSQPALLHYPKSGAQAIPQVGIANCQRATASAGRAPVDFPMPKSMHRSVPPLVPMAPYCAMAAFTPCALRGAFPRSW